jgi:hypothetical protein
MILIKNIFIFTILFSALTFVVHLDAAYAAKGGHSSGSGSHSGGSGGHDTVGDDHSEDSSHSDNKDGKGKGPKYRGGRGTKVGHGGKGGHSVEDKIFHGKHGKRWSDDWTGGGHDTDGDDHGDSQSGDDESHEH